MGSYKDSNGKVWTFSLKYELVLFLKDKISIDLLEPYENGNNTLEEVVRNRYRMLELLFNTVKFCNRDVSDAEIWESFDNGGAVEAQEAFFGDWVNFSQMNKRPDVAVAIQKAQELIQAGIRAAEAEIKAVDSSQVIARITQAVHGNISAPTPSFGNSQDG